MRYTTGNGNLKQRILAAALCTLASAGVAQAAFVKGTSGNDVLFGLDDDTQANPLIQPAGTAANQSLDKSDVIDGGAGDDLLIGLGGSDVMLGGPGNDILVGGTEQGVTPNSDTMIGDAGNDIALWRGGDGSEAFIGGKGTDALIFGNIDRDASNIPTITPTTGRFNKTGIPTADVTNQGGFCTVERVTDPDFGYQFLVRFFVRATGNLAVTVRTRDVEQVFCTSEAGHEITVADLTADKPDFVVVSLDEVKKINPAVGKIIR
jgi:Ca2+-binding RTX toxin-like protein